MIKTGRTRSRLVDGEPSIQVVLVMIESRGVGNNRLDDNQA
jgi:hypothetical protein